MANLIDRFVPLEPSEESCNIISSKLEPTEAETLVKKCVHAVLILAQEQETIKRRDLNRLVFPTNLHFKTAGALIEVANKKLKDKFGMRLYEMDAKYLLLNSSPDMADHLEYDDKQSESLTVLYLILMDLFGCPEGRLCMEEIAKSLSPLELSDDELKAYIDKFIKRLYLVQGKYNDKISYSWGPRANAEVDPDEFFECFLELVGGGSRDEWPDQKIRVDKLKSIANR